MPEIFSKGLRVILKEWLLTGAFSGCLLTSLLAKRLPRYTRQDAEILFILWVYLALIKGLERGKFFKALASRLSVGRMIGLKLVSGVFSLAMFVTNDAAVLIGVPLVMKLNISRKRLLVIMVALAANAGSSLTPFGNPQNLFLYWFYQLQFLDFLKAIFPLPLVTGLFLFFLSLLLWRDVSVIDSQRLSFNRSNLYFLFAFLLFILVTLKILPFWVGFFILLVISVFDFESLKVDYALLLTFFFFFGFTDNLKDILYFHFNDPFHVFLGSLVASQFISNVPAALLFCDFTHCWRALLWGVNVGGFGSLFASLANLIAYRLYVRHALNESELAFFVLFHVFGYFILFLGILTYFLVYY